MVTAAKQFSWHPSTDARIHHGATDRGQPDPEVHWYPHVQECLRIVLPSDWVLHLQFRLEANSTGRQRMILFGRRVKSLDHSTPNTQRATFNSDERDGSDFFLRPRLDDEQAAALSRLLGPGSFPHVRGKRILLGDAPPALLFRRFLSALIGLEVVKDPEAPKGATALLRNLEAPPEEFDAADLARTILINEGKLSKVPRSHRARCQRLLAEAQAHFSRRHTDGLLHCEVCNWAAPLPIRRQVVQIHHHQRPISVYPKQGLRLTLQEALANLVPLCPNCHDLHDAKPGGGRYTLDELRATIVPEASSQTLSVVSSATR